MVSIVVLKYAFSTSGQILFDFRNWFEEDILESLKCTKHLEDTHYQVQNQYAENCV